MTQALDVNERISELGRSQAVGAPASTTVRAASKFGSFAITFGISFAILYTLFEQLNWPLFTYHPAVGKLDFWMQRPRSGEGPPMYWYGWLALSFGGAFVLGLLATRGSSQWLYRSTLFCCILAALWPAAYAFAVFVADRASFDAEFLKSVWLAAIPALVATAAVTYLASSQFAQRAWTWWVLIMPIGGLAILGYSLKSYFLR
jgi:hypothetical protein